MPLNSKKYTPPCEQVEKIMHPFSIRYKQGLTLPDVVQRMLPLSWESWRYYGATGAIAAGVGAI